MCDDANEENAEDIDVWCVSEQTSQVDTRRRYTFYLHKNFLGIGREKFVRIDQIKWFKGVLQAEFMSSGAGYLFYDSALDATALDNLKTKPKKPNSVRCYVEIDEEKFYIFFSEYGDLNNAQEWKIAEAGILGAIQLYRNTFDWINK